MFRIIEDVSVLTIRTWWAEGIGICHNFDVIDENEEIDTFMKCIRLEEDVEMRIIDCVNIARISLLA